MQFKACSIRTSTLYSALVLFSAIFSLIVYILVDLIYVLIDPRISH